MLLAPSDTEGCGLAADLALLADRPVLSSPVGPAELEPAFVRAVPLEAEAAAPPRRRAAPGGALLRLLPPALRRARPEVVDGLRRGRLARGCPHRRRCGCSVARCHALGAKVPFDECVRRLALRALPTPSE